MSESELDPIAPAEAVEFYFEQRRSELSKSTIENQRYRLDAFVEWCVLEDIQNLNALSGRDLHRFRSWRGSDIKTVTLVGHLQTLRVFLEFCATIDGVQPGLREQVLIPNVAPSEESRDEMLGEERARALLEYLDRFQYASRDHVVVAVLWHTGIRLGTLRAIDVRDVDFEERCVDLRHRPETETPLKNRQAAERSISVGPRYCEVLRDYLAQNRKEVADEFGREPLVTSTQGRLSATAIRDSIYRVTRPCESGECPHDRDPETCEAMDGAAQTASLCPSSRSPHSIRRGSITTHLRENTPQEVVTERMNVSKDVLDQHYDERSDREKMELRRQFLEGA
jgi:site-specific recombinase XerD